MSVEPVNCPRCGTALSPSAPEGLCPRCLGAFNFATETVLPGEEKLAAQPPLTPEQIGVHFPQLEIIECLGRGGMGVVYKARQKSLNRLVALKLLAPERVQDARFAERFAHEAQALAKLSHPSIVTIHDFGEAGGFYFLLMEFVDGVNLRQLLRSRKLTPEEALAIVPPLCDALQYAHERGIVHRDIKPENLLLDKDGRVKVADFGIAKILSVEKIPADSERPPMKTEISGRSESAGIPVQSVAAGTPGYMAPEQSTAPRKVDARADIYSLGVVFYEMLTGELPGAKLQPPSKKVQIDVRLDEIVLRALEQTPELRYATAAEFRAQIETVTSSPRSSRGNEASSETSESGKQRGEFDQRLLPSSPTGQGTSIRKIGMSTLTTPAEIGTLRGQFSCYRTHGQLILDDRWLTHACGGHTTVIPLAAIRDVSIGHYPRVMNPAGIGLLSIAYDEGGQRRQVLLSPTEGFFGLPSTWNARVSEWHAAISQAVAAATGQAPTSTRADQLGIPSSAKSSLLLLLAPVLLGVVPIFAVLMHQSPGLPLLARVGPFLLVMGVALLICLAPCFWFRFFGKKQERNGSILGLFIPVLLAVGLIAVGGFGVFKRQRPLTQPAVPQPILSTARPERVPDSVRSLKDSPFLARLPDGGSIELLAVRNHPSTNEPWWQPDGSPSTYDAAIEAELKEQVRPGVMALARITYPTYPTNYGHRPKSADDVGPAAVRLGIGPRFAVKNGRRLPMTESAASPQVSFGVICFENVLAKGNDSTLFVPVATAEWQTLTVQQPGGLLSRFFDPVRKDWKFSATPLGNLKVSITHLNETPGMEYRLVAVDLDGKSFIPARTTRTKRSTENFSSFEAEFDGTGGSGNNGGLPLRRIREVRWMGRPYHNVEFRHVSLEPGHRTTLEVMDFGAEEQKVASSAAAPARSGLAMLSPIVGEDVGTNVFRAVTTLVKPRHVAVWALEIKTDNGWRQMPGLDLWAVAFEDPAPFSVVAQWNTDAWTNGLKGFELTAEALGQQFTSRPSRMDWLNDYSWQATPQDRSHWVGPGEWNLNEPNPITIFEGVKRNDPNARATIRLNFSLFALPDDFVSAQRGNYIYFGQNWRSRLGLPPDFPNTAVSSPHVAGPGNVAVGVPWIAILAVLILFAMVGGGVLLLVLLWRKLGSTAARVLAVLSGVALLLFLLVIGSVFVWLKVRRAEASRAVEVVQQAEMAKLQETQRHSEGRKNGMAAPPQMTGPSAGIGVALSRQNGRFIIGSIIPNTPAARDGRLQVGDQVLCVEEEGRDYVQLDGLKFSEAVKLMRGAPGSTVTLHVVPRGQPLEERKFIKLVREQLALLEAEVRGQLLTNAPVPRTPDP